jgi:hypothetical protein
MPNFSAVSTSANFEDATSVTFSHTVASGSDRVLLVGVRTRTDAGASYVTGVTFNSVAMTLHQITSWERTAGTWYNVEVWRLIAPDVTTANVVVTASALIDDGSAAAMSFTGVHQTTPIEAAGNTLASTDVATATASVTTTSANAMVASFIYSRAASGTIVAGPTERDNVALTFGATDFVASATEAVASASTVTHSWTNVANASSIGIAVSLRDVGVSTAPFRPYYAY